MPRGTGGGGPAGVRPMAILVGVALSLVLFGVISSLMGVVYGLWSRVSYPSWAYLVVHALALLAGGGWAGGRGPKAGWLHGLGVGLLYVAAALWILPHDPAVTIADSGRALAVALPFALLGGALGRNLAGTSR